MAASQPSNIEPYIQQDNPVTKEPLERKIADANQSTESVRGADAVPATHTGDGTFSSLGRGVRGGQPSDATETRNTNPGRTSDEEPQNENVDAEQMASAGEGKVAAAVERKSGTQKAPGDGEVTFDDYASDLDRKKAEQAEAREEIQQARKSGVDVDGGAGARSAGTEDISSV
ncbi:hypothetical protein VP1G_01865 [Cytospora mali]|uniref:Uncharacterized protein n=1 Tax=Cytospora mali TaxID=578113 RepID=A0A194URZ8_CYTMA|nr:hypothetical protein VP1G_01865 [Valsa mali var. pyri (nom. inval.)]